MSHSVQLRITIGIGVALVTLLPVGCTGGQPTDRATPNSKSVRGTSDQAPRRQANRALRIVPRAPNHGLSNFWWQHLGARGIAAAWIGPITANAHGDHIRIVNLLYHLPGNDQPVAAVSRAVGIDDTKALALSSKQHEFTIQPSNGLTWGGVAAPNHLQTDLTGFDSD